MHQNSPFWAQKSKNFPRPHYRASAPGVTATAPSDAPENSSESSEPILMIFFEKLGVAQNKLSLVKKCH